jgi:AcrR family transcriptional regulator
LFLKFGFDETTVADVAAAAGVSSVTVFRHFPTKEDLVLTDDFDPVLVERIKAEPRNVRLVQRVARVLLRSLRAATASERDLLLDRLRLGLATPALRRRRWDALYETQLAIAAALKDDGSSAMGELRVAVAAGACLFAAAEAMTRWAAEEGRADPVLLMREALEVVAGPLGDDRRKAKRKGAES